MNLGKKTLVLAIVGLFFGAGIVPTIIGENMVNEDPWVHVIYPNGGEVLSKTVLVRWEWGGTVPIQPVLFNLYALYNSNRFAIATNWQGTECFWDTTKLDNGEYELYVELWTDENLDGVGDRFWASDYSDNVFMLSNEKPPNRPSKPSGISIGYTFIEYGFSTVSIDPNDDDVQYAWDWDGDDVIDEGWSEFYSSGERVTRYHQWESNGSYNVQVKARDRNGQESYFSRSKSVTINKNHPPQKPLTPNGKPDGKVGTEYQYQTVTTDKEDQDIYYLFDWGDQTNSSWLGPYENGETCKAMHSWDEEGNYSIRVRAKDASGLESEWSESLTVIMPKTRQKNNPLLWLLYYYFDFIKLRFG